VASALSCSTVTGDVKAATGVRALLGYCVQSVNSTLSTETLQYSFYTKACCVTKSCCVLTRLGPEKAGRTKATLSEQMGSYRLRVSLPLCIGPLKVQERGSHQNWRKPKPLLMQNQLPRLSLHLPVALMPKVLVYTYISCHIQFGCGKKDQSYVIGWLVPEGSIVFRIADHAAKLTWPLNCLMSRLVADTILLYSKSRLFVVLWCIAAHPDAYDCSWCKPLCTHSI